MRAYLAIPTAIALAVLAQPAAAQNNPPRITRVAPFPNGELFTRFAEQSSRAAIGITTSSGATVRDTLGVLVSSVYQGSPAEKAGIEEGNRIASVNGVSLKLSPADVGDDQMAGLMSRRLIRELDRLKPGDDVDLRVFGNGQSKSVKIKTVESGDLYRSRTISRFDERAVLGINFAVTGSIRDTIGVFVMSVDDGGPAAKAGIEEGSRIVSINGVDVRVRRGDEEDGMLRTMGINRFNREMGKLKPGDAAELRVYSGGQVRTVRVTAARASDLPRRSRSVTIMGGDRIVVPPMEDMHFEDMHVNIDGIEIGENVRRAVERAMEGAGRGLEGLGHVFEDMGRGLGRTRVQW